MASPVEHVSLGYPVAANADDGIYRFAPIKFSCPHDLVNLAAVIILCAVSILADFDHRPLECCEVCAVQHVDLVFIAVHLQQRGRAEMELR